MSYRIERGNGWLMCVREYIMVGGWINNYVGCFLLFVVW